MITSNQYPNLWSLSHCFTSNVETLSFFQDLVNYSNIVENISNSAMLVKMGDSFYLLFYIEVLDEVPRVKCLVLEINLEKINSLLSMGDQIISNSPSYFIDEVTSKKDEMIDTLLKQRNDQVKSLKMQKQESEKLAKEQQLRMVNIRQGFRRIINKEVKRKLAKASKSTQIEIAEICFRSMQFKFKGLDKLDDKEEKEIKEWLKVFLDVLGV
ncbi:hypothetical protein BN7_2547 [Wickerhamomyces ciferrii]|uniref:Uncharacterized protein n=1 Tax=Wickerhamomyces ciferrii (strain ATCC 14091 / BCRC 22168 / CBS 111 / JCM 3599 / NBRC 0793 / NRRL Y-1031 F-60-10) TaxID=1206466 RepID=K0KD19_WICCF|nr:uncharacterized protein BN7_2547 [Wickerhamomyces ciferrii]CCH43000.1 hypothetical protein BN7_2547 [Wickerhamomyces ciferrii]